MANAAGVLVGATLGLMIGRFIPERIRNTAMSALGLTIFFLGLQMAIDPAPSTAGRFLDADGQRPQTNTLALTVGLMTGSLFGELFQIEQRLGRLAIRLQEQATSFSNRRAQDLAGAGGTGPALAEGFVTASLLYCVGAMAVIGPIQEASGHPQVLYLKAMVDGFLAILLATKLGPGVGLSAVPILLYQGGITLAARNVTPFLTPSVEATLNAAGGLLIAAIGLDLMGTKRLPVGNMLPGVFVATILAYLFS
jgi:uncharacterized membrane protein YqgA involved in biofilm formation